MRKFLIPAAALVALAGGSALIAQMPTSAPGTKDAAKVTGGSYKVDGGHTQVVFAWDHMGFTNNAGTIAEPTGTLTLDKANPANSKVEVTFQIANLRTGVAKLDEHLLKPDFFDAAKFPTATFVSTSVKPEGATSAEITGNLTLHGVTKPVTLDAEFYGVGPSPMSKKENIGFVATGTIKRSDFGMGYAVPLVSDAIALKVIAGFEKQ
ncbi:YceI family protein [Sphingobium olei]|uniref:YceI family protein n=1 Tax=Sphingobium olei TaxID=420955 RepID=A0ABW3P7Z0_9SPHN|nr:YceI family protein [Sphingobium sp.]